MVLLRKFSYGRIFFLKVLLVFWIYFFHMLIKTFYGNKIKITVTKVIGKNSPYYVIEPSEITHLQMRSSSTRY